MITWCYILRLLRNTIFSIVAYLSSKRWMRIKWIGVNDQVLLIPLYDGYSWPRRGLATTSPGIFSLYNLAIDQKHLESFEMWCWRRMEKISWTDHVRNEEVLLRVKEQRNILHEISKRKANWMGHILRRNSILQRVIEEKVKGVIEVTGRRGRRRRKLLDDLEERRWYSNLKEKALDRTMWRARFGRGFGPVVRQTTKWMNLEKPDFFPQNRMYILAKNYCCRQSKACRSDYSHCTDWAVLNFIYVWLREDFSVQCQLV